MPSAATIASSQQAVLGRLALGRLAEQLGVVAERELRSWSSRLWTSRVTAPRSRPLGTFGADVDPARGVLALDDVRRRADRHVGDVAERAPARRSGVSIGRLRIAVRLSRVFGVLQTMTLVDTCRRWNMSPTSSPATSVPAARRTSPGLRP